jgi:hypothetical protein
MSKKFDEIISLGTEVGLLDSAFSRFALKVCEMAAQGKLMEEDADATWKSFRNARQKAGGRCRPSTSDGQQVSKLRQIIKVGCAQGMNAWNTLATASNLFVNEFSDEKYLGRRPYSGEYDCMVHIARSALRSRGALSESEIRKHMVK